MTPQVEKWIEDAKPGQHVCYHVGNLAADRAVPVKGEAAVFAPWPTADAYREAAEAGKVALTQGVLSRNRDTGLSVYEYFATRI